MSKEINLEVGNPKNIINNPRRENSKTSSRTSSESKVPSKSELKEIEEEAREFQEELERQEFASVISEKLNKLEFTDDEDDNNPHETAIIESDSEKNEPEETKSEPRETKNEPNINNNDDNDNNDDEFNRLNRQTKMLVTELKSEANRYVKANREERKEIYNNISSGQLELFINFCLADSDLNDEALKKALEEALKSEDRSGASRSIGFKSKDVPKFTGDQEVLDLGLWIFKINQNQKASYLNDGETAIAISDCLLSTPAFMYQAYIENCEKTKKRASWIEIQELFRGVWNNKHQQLELRHKLLTLKVKNRNINEYTNKFSELTTRISDITESEKISKFIEGLDEPHKSKIFSESPETIVKTMQLAITYYNLDPKHTSILYAKQINSSRGNNQSASNYKRFQNNNRSRQDQFHNQGQRNASQNSYFNQQNRSNQPPAYGSINRQQQPKMIQNKLNQVERLCFICKRPGHLKASCPMIKRSNALTEDHKEGIYPELKNLEATEYVPPRHKQVLVALTNQSGLMGTTAEIENKQIECFFDTGAEVSIMNTVTANELEIKTYPSDVKIKVANNEVIDCFGETGKLKVRVGDSVCDLKFVIMEHDDHPVLLGLDWFGHTGASLNPAANALTFPRHVLMLNTKTKIAESLSVVDDDPEGRLSNLMHQDDNLDEIGIDPHQKQAEEEIINQIKPEIELEPELQEQFNSLIPIIAERCSTGSSDLGQFNGKEMVIELESQIPVSRPVHRRSQAEMDTLEEHVNQLYVDGVIEPSNSSYNNPVMMIKKKTGSYRLINDYRLLNAIMISFIFPFALVAHILDTLADYHFYSSTDMSSGFWQCPLEYNSRKYTAFSTQKGHWQYKVCPQGVKTGPAWFSLCVSLAMRECRGFALNYFDDIVIYSKTITDHLRHIRLVMNALKKYGFKLSAKKSNWCAKEINLLGYVVSGTHVKINPDKIITIKNRPEPSNAKQVQQCLGLFNFYRRFIPNFAAMSKPLYKLIEKGAKFIWTEECKGNYQHFIQCLISEPAMAQPIIGQPFIVYSDGSKYAIGGVLAQKIRGIEHIIEYASRLLKGPELNYGISDIECLAAVFLIRKWHHYLYGVPFTLYTDHKALIQLMGIRDYIGRLGRQAMLLQEYTFSIVYLPGEDNAAADITSRPTLQEKEQSTRFALAVQTRASADREADTVLEYQFKTTDIYDNIPFLEFLKTGKLLPGLTRSQVKQIKNNASNYKIYDGIPTVYIKRNDNYKQIPFKSTRKDIIMHAHLIGHFGVESTIKRICERFYWPKMYQQVASHINKCIICQRNSKAPAIEHPAKVLPITGLFDRIGMDLVGGLPISKEGYSRVLVIVEYFSKMIRIFPLKTKTMEEVADKLWKYISVYGPPKTILSDQGTEFMNHLISTLLLNTGIDRRITSSYNPRVDGLCERANQTIINILRKCSEGNPIDWPNWLSFIEYAYNTRQHSSTKYSPNELLFGVRTNEFGNYTNEDLPNKCTLSTQEDEEITLKRASEIKALIESKRPEAIKNIERAQEKQTKIQNARNNPTTETLKPGTPVMVKSEGIIGKLEPRFYGRFFIKKMTEGGNYILSNALGETLDNSFPVTKLKIIEEENELASVEVEKILSKRINSTSSAIEYLVKWKDFDESHNEWLTEDKFDDTKCIRQYNESIHRQDQTEVTSPVEKPKRRGRPPRQLMTPFMATIIFITIFLLPAIATTIIEGNFRYCDKSESTMIDLENNCESRKEFQKDFPELDNYETVPECFMGHTYQCPGGVNRDSMSVIESQAKRHNLTITYKQVLETTKAYVLSKIREPIVGRAIECHVTELRVILRSDIWWNKQPAIITSQAIQITKEQCQEIKETKLCSDRPMICTNEYNCVTPDLDYSNEYIWFDTRIVNSKKCTIVERQIKGENTSTNLFTNEKNKCKVYDGFCLLPDSIIIWTPQYVVHECPYEIIAEVELLRIDKDVMQARQQGMAFQIIKQEIVCKSPNITIYHTREGLYITKKSEMKNYKVQKGNSQTINSNLLLITDEDNYHASLIRMIKELTQRDCYNTLNILNIISKSKDDEYFKIKDLNGNELIVYTDNSQIFLPHCITINNITIVNSDKDCYNLIPIEIRSDNSTEKLFLTNNKIIRKTASKVDCSNARYNSYIIINETHAIERKSINSKVNISVVNKRRLMIKINNQDNNWTKLNFNHFKGLMESIKVEDFESNKLISENGRYFYPQLEYEHSLNFQSHAKEVYSNVHNYFSRIKSIILTTFIIIIASITIVISIIITIKCKNLCKPRFRTKMIPSTSGNFEMKSLNSRQVNLVKGFLPEKKSKQVNQINLQKSTEKSTESLDSTTKKIISDFKNRRFY